MSAPDFVHLRLHTEYSIVDGLVRIDEAIDAAVNDNQGALAITDLNNVFGLIKFYTAARKKGIKPIAGCDVWLENEGNRNQPYRLLLLIKNRLGYQTLCELLTQASLYNQHMGRGEIRQSWLAQKAKDGDMGLIALSGGRYGDIGHALAVNRYDEALACAKRWKSIFKDNFYIEIQNTGNVDDNKAIEDAVTLANQVDLPVVATHPIQFIHPEQYRAHEARTCISSGYILDDQKREHLFNEEQYFLTQKAMIQRFAAYPSAIANTVEIAKRCNLILELGTHKLPNRPMKPGVNLTQDEFLAQQAKVGLEERIKILFPDEDVRKKERQRYDERLAYEIDTIIKMGFAGYFLIVAEFINWSKDNDVPVGPGRGSGAGSLVAYALKITNLDPIKYNLLFERFLNPERVSLPDFDVDFCQLKRGKVIQHVKDIYGEQAVSQIATFGTMAAKAAVRDTGRVLNYGYTFCDGIAKLIPMRPGDTVTIEKALKEEPLLAERKEKEDDVDDILTLAQKVEGLTRNVGMHAGGVVIAPGKLTDFCPLYTQDFISEEEKQSRKAKGENQAIISQFDKGDVEAIGLVKFDFLGLTTLTILDFTIQNMLRVNPQLKGFSVDNIALDDAATFQSLTDAKTVAVFQLESRGMRDMLKKAKPDRFEDIIALVALYRPGPMELIPDYCKRKHGEAFDYPDDRTKGILEETYGIMIYQEQVMQMAQVIGGYTLGGADLLRRAMGKKDAAAMAKHRATFREGASKNNISEQKADEIFDLMEKFAGYGFNKSHATAYALLSYQTAYLKVHYPAEFMAANLSLGMAAVEKVQVLVEDAQNTCRVSIKPPDVATSLYYFTAEKSHEAAQKADVIRYGLGAVKGVGEDAVAAIIKAREEKPFTSLFDFCERVDRHRVNRRAMESLIRAGALDCLNEDRFVMLSSLDLALEAANQVTANSMQGSLFGEDDSTISSVLTYANVKPWSLKEKLVAEKEALGFCLSANLFTAYETEVSQCGQHFTPLNQLEVSRDIKWVVGVIAQARTQMTQKGRLMILTIDDGRSHVDVTAYTDKFAQDLHLFKVDAFVAVQGRVSEDTFSGGFRINAIQILDIVRFRLLFAKKIVVTLTAAIDWNKLPKILTPFLLKDGLSIIGEYSNKKASCLFDFGEKWKVNPSDECLMALQSVMPDAHIVFKD